MNKTKVSIILPCRNEKEAIGECLLEIKRVIKENNLDAEIIVSDSSQDGSDKIAEELGAKVTKHDLEGYGLAITQGVKKASGEIIIYADADGTYNFGEIPIFLNELNSDSIIIGSRLWGDIKTGAMPFSHRFIGIPILNILLFLLFGIRISDSQSGYRALRKKTFDDLNLKTKGMEFATEMLIKAKKNNIKIKEIPIGYACRRGNSKLRSYRDGLAHVKYILMQAPIGLYFITGGTLFIVGLVGLIFGRDMNAFFNSATVKILFPFLGVQVLFLGLFAKTYLYTKFDEKIDFVRKFYSIFKLKTAILGSSLFILVPVLLKIFGLAAGIFDPLLVSTLIGLQIIFNSLILSSLSIK